MYKGPAGGLQWDSNPQYLNTYVSRGAGSTTDLSPTHTSVSDYRYKGEDNFDVYSYQLRNHVT